MNQKLFSWGVWWPACAGLIALGAVQAGCRTPQPAAAGAARKPLTYEAIFGSDAVDFDGDYVRDLAWSSDGFLLRREDGRQMKEDPVTGERRPAWDVDQLATVLEEDGGLSADAAREMARHPKATSADENVLLLEQEGALFRYRWSDQALLRIAEPGEDRELVTLSPDGRFVGYVHENNLYALDAVENTRSQLTADGSATVLNGILDWVYQEEVYGRGDWQAYWWSPDGAHVAYLQLDEAGVPEYPLVDFTSTHPQAEPQRFPQAGDQNPRVRLGVVPAAGGETVWVELGAPDAVDPLIVGVGWSPDNEVLFVVQDREQRWLQLQAADSATGASRTLLREESPAWATFYGLPEWLDDGTFLWRSARDGWAHLYHYSAEGRLLRPVTQGQWDVRDLLGVDEEVGWVYFTGTVDDPGERHAYRVPLTGGPVERLTERGYSHRVRLDPERRYFVDTFSNLTTPPKVMLRCCDGTLQRVISANEVHELDEYALSPPERLRVPTPRGYTLNGVLLRPPNMAPGQMYPLIVFTYGGPGDPIVANRWEGRGYLHKQYLAQQGYLIWTVDPHSASGEGPVSAWQAYLQLGVTELADLEDSVRWLEANAQADPLREAILGSSYGGYIAAYALTHGDIFDVGVAESALMDWRDYDTIYTERFMRTPANNPDGYQAASVVGAAAHLHGRLLIGHGGMDDNVHLSNALQLVQKLQEAGREFDLMIYPTAGHGLWDAHWQRLQWDFIRRHAPPGGVKRPEPAPSPR